MKNTINTFFLICVYVGLSAQPKYDTLYNSTIITLTKIGLPSSTIISKIQTSIASFDVSTNALIELNKNGVNGEVLNEMIKRTDNANTASLKEVNSTNPNVMHKTGIYYYDPNDKASPLKRIDPSVVSGTKGGGFGQALGSAYTYGIAKTTHRSTLAGLHSATQIAENAPTFYFYFQNDTKANSDNWFFATATSPKEFILVWMYTKVDNREIETGSGNAYGNSSGVPTKDIIPFDISQVAEGIYKVVLTKKMEKGEYCFNYASTPPSQYSNNKVFDFGISTPLPK